MKPIWANAANGSIPETEQAARFLARDFKKLEVAMYRMRLK